MSRYTTDERWKATRRQKLRLNPVCERCGTAATDVHHLDELGLDGPRRYDLGNLESLCHPCHSKETTRFGIGKRGSRLRPAEQHPGLISD